MFIGGLLSKKKIQLQLLAFNCYPMASSFTKWLTGNSFFTKSFFIYRAKTKTVKQKLKYKSANVAMFKLNTDIYYLE